MEHQVLFAQIRAVNEDHVYAHFGVSVALDGYKTELLDMIREHSLSHCSRNRFPDSDSGLNEGYVTPNAGFSRPL